MRESAYAGRRFTGAQVIRRTRERREPEPAHQPEFLAWLRRTHGCKVAEKGFGGCRGRLTFHHVRNHGGKRDDRKGFILCVAHHLHDGGPDAIERGRDRFERRFGFSIEAEAGKGWEEWRAQSPQR